MKIALRINWILTILLSISTGLFKLMQQQADIDLFKTIGFSMTAVTMLGVIQLLGGLLLIPAKTRKIGAYVMIPTFIVASIAVFANQLFVFGIVSLLFILMACLVLLMQSKYTLKVS